MRRSFSLALCISLAVAGTLGAVAALPTLRHAHILHPYSGKPITVPGVDGAGNLLFSGWRVQPAGRELQIGDMPYGGAFSPDSKLFAIVNSGYTKHALNIIDVATEKVAVSLPLLTSFNGVCWSPEGNRIFVSGGARNPDADLLVFSRGTDGTWKAETGFKLTGNDPQKSCIGGLAISTDGKTLYAANISDDSLSILASDTGNSIARVPVGDHPGACRLSKDGNTLYIANWGGAEAVAVDVRDPSQAKVVQHYPVGAQPSDLVLSADDRLFVACTGADTVVVYDLKTGKQMETIRTALTARAPAGNTPDAVALSPDGKTLYIANADSNNVCVADVSKRGKSRVRGFIPTGWYPTAVQVTPDGKKVIIGTGKGRGTGTNVIQSASGGPLRRVHHGSLLKGILQFVDTPGDKQLAEYSKVVAANTPYKDDVLDRVASKEKTAIPTRVGEASPIKYVLYIIKENRTYDQVFSDLPQGNGDKSLLMFGREVTPNHHALAEQFVLLDNLYCSGEVSQDGHPWSTSAYATAFTQRSWVLGYSGRGKPADEASVDDPTTGYLWEACKKKGLSFRSYGEYRDHPTLAGNTSDRYVGKVRPGENPPGRDFEKADVFIEEFKEMEREKRIPRFMVMSLGEDHTSGTRPGSFTPQACVASNDAALGKIVEAISKSSVWKETAIFVIEDDAQNGPDHQDSHRTVGLVISPYTRRGVVDSTMYTTCSMLRTMELILGLPPMTQYDASATPMFASFTNTADLSGYNALPAKIDLMAKNPGNAVGARESMKLDFSEYDHLTVAEEDTLNQVLWHSIKGKNVPYPGATRSAYQP